MFLRVINKTKITYLGIWFASENFGVVLVKIFSFFTFPPQIFQIIYKKIALYIINLYSLYVIIIYKCTIFHFFFFFFMKSIKYFFLFTFVYRITYVFIIFFVYFINKMFNIMGGHLSYLCTKRTSFHFNNLLLYNMFWDK